MIVDLLRNDVSRISDDVRVSNLFGRASAADRAADHFDGDGQDPARDRLAGGLWRARCFRAALTGAPKIAAMQAIAAFETSPRGAYCGTLGVLQPGTKALFSVGIRTVTISNGKASCGVGSGITWDSRSGEEFAEGRIKQRFLWRASASFELLETLRLEFGVYWLLHRQALRLWVPQPRSVEPPA